MSFRTACAELGRIKDPFEIIEGPGFPIKTDEQKLMFLTSKTMFPVQRYIYEKTKEKYYAGVPAWLRILKARHHGVSSIISAIMFGYTASQDYVSSLVMGDQLGNTDWIFGMWAFGLRELQKRGNMPARRFENRRLIEWEGTSSSVRAETGANIDIVHAKSWTAVHLSEYPYYPYPVKLMEELLPGARKAKFFFIEGTGHGVGTPFHNEWLEGEKEKGAFENIFFGWHMHPEYRKEV